MSEEPPAHLYLWGDCGGPGPGAGATWTFAHLMTPARRLALLGVQWCYSWARAPPHDWRPAHLSGWGPQVWADPRLCPLLALLQTILCHSGKSEALPVSRLVSSPTSYRLPLSAGPLGCYSIRWFLPGSSHSGKNRGAWRIRSRTLRCPDAVGGAEPWLVCRSAGCLPNRLSLTGCILRYYSFRWLIVLSHQYFTACIDFFL